MSQVIVVTSGKGGVGKTTTTANLAAGLAMMGSRAVAITPKGYRIFREAFGAQLD